MVYIQMITAWKPVIVTDCDLFN